MYKQYLLVVDKLWNIELVVLQLSISLNVNNSFLSLVEGMAVVHLQNDLQHLHYAVTIFETAIWPEIWLQKYLTCISC